MPQSDGFDNRIKMPKINQNQMSQIPILVPPKAQMTGTVY